MKARRALRGAVAYHSGRVAEEAVAALYEGAGSAIAARRWRGQSGEIDLIAREGARLVFVEVKKADTHDLAAERLGDRQIQRLWGAASEFIGGEPAGQDTEVRFDVALVDAQGRIQIRRNVLAG
jgi:putative endonuclease